MKLTIEKKRPSNLSATQIREVLTDCDDVLVDKFINFHRENKDVYELFLINSVIMQQRGYGTYSAWTIANKIRWDKDFQTKSAAEEFKINNNYIALYARLVMAKTPSLEGFFTLRATKKASSL